MNILILGVVGFYGANLVRRCLLAEQNRIAIMDSPEWLLHS